MSKRILALMLSLVMVIGVLPLSVLAGESDSAAKTLQATKQIVQNGTKQKVRMEKYPFSKLSRLQEQKTNSM